MNHFKVLFYIFHLITILYKYITLMVAKINALAKTSVYDVN
jgi:hypothetical protein